MNRVLITQINDDNKRIDKIIRILFPGIPVSALYRAIRLGKIRVNDKKIDPSYKVRTGDRITHSLKEEELSALAVRPKDLKNKVPAELKDSILLRNENLLALNKPPGIPVHGNHSLCSLLQPYLDSLASPSLSFKPGPLHRLDKDTSGILFFGLSLEGARSFTDLLINRILEKCYLGLLLGDLKEPLLLEDRLLKNKEGLVTVDDQGKRAGTALYPLIRNGKYTFVRIRIYTGIKHQIRIQSAHHGFPLAGDIKYGGRDRIRPYLLHAYSYSLKEEIPALGFNRLTAPLPESALVKLKTAFPERKESDFLKFLGYNGVNDAL